MARRVCFVATFFFLLCSVVIPGRVGAGPPAGGVEGVHGNIPGFPPNDCMVCHDIVPGSTGRDSVLRPNQTCLGCHTDGPTYGTGNTLIQDRPNATPVGNHASLVTGSPHLTYGDFGASWPFVEYEQEIHCTTCHDPHRTFDPVDPDPSTHNVKYIRDHTDDFQVNALSQVVWTPYKQLKVIDNSGPAPVEIVKQVDQDIVYTGTEDLADGVGMLLAETDVCEVCHTLTSHHQLDGNAPGGQSHFDGEDCTSCHTHPTGFAPSGGQPLTGPHAGFGDPDCGACHESTFFPGGPDNPSGLASVFCQTCHGPGTASYSEIHSHLVSGTDRFDYTIECTACHDQHGWAVTNVDGNDNLDYVRAAINESISVIDRTQSPPVQVDKTITAQIVFDSLDDFADGDAQYDQDICVTCHTLTNHHQNDGDAPGGQSHFDGEDCTSCHTHPTGFAPSGGQPLTGPHAGFGDPDCGACHESTFFPGGPDNPSGLASVFCQTCHGPGTASYSEIHSHLVSGTNRFDYTIECTACHDQHGWAVTNVDGNDNLDYVRAAINESISVIDRTQSPPVQVDKTITAQIVFDSLDDFANGDAQYDQDICVTCHTLTNHHQNDGDAQGGQSHFDGVDCTSCHAHLEGFGPPGGLSGPPIQGPHATIPGFADGDCLACHQLFDDLDTMITRSTEVCLACHSDSFSIVPATPEHVHSSAVSGSSRFDYAVECATCHAPHGWQSEVGNASGSDNIKYVRANIDEMITVLDNTVDPPATVIKEIDSNVTFTHLSGPDSFADGDLSYTDDVCTTCHTLTNHHQNDGTAPGGQVHFSGETCTGCHLHPEGFGGFRGPHPQAVTDCGNCHLGFDGQPDLTAIHRNDCESCHPSGVPETILGPAGIWNQECTACHNPSVAETGFMDAPTKGHRCVVCHGQQLGTAGINGIHEEHAESANCVVCHGFIPDVGTAIGSGNRQICVTCHGSPRSGVSIEDIHEEHTEKGLSCLECHGGERPPVDVVFGPPVGGASVVCEICHDYENDSSQEIHEKHTDMPLDCGSCHADANLQDDREPMPPIDDDRRAMVDRSDYNECSLCHDRENAGVRAIHREHVADQWQWCHNCHEADDARPPGNAPPVTAPSESCELCHGSGRTYDDSQPFDVHEHHAKKNKCYACHQTVPQVVDWPRSWLGGEDTGNGGGSDCDEADPDVWSVPSEVTDLEFADGSVLRWSPPTDPGATVVAYDTLRSPDPADFMLSAMCIEQDDSSDVQSRDASIPPDGVVFHYLVRAGNACPAGEGTLGRSSDGAERMGAACP